MATILITLLAIVFFSFSSNPWTMLALIRGETLIVEPAVLEVGEAHEGVSRVLPIRLHNYGNKPIKVIGGNVSCTCMTLTDLPVTVPAKGKVTVRIEVKFRGTKGRFNHSFRFFHDGVEQTTSGRFTGYVIPPVILSATKTQVHHSMNALH